MAEFKIPKYKHKGDPISLDECYRQLSDLSYQSPVEIMYQGFETKLEGDVMEAIHSYGVSVDKDELIKALRYDREQYRKGYADACIGRLDEIKSELAREIFEEIEKYLISSDVLPDCCRLADMNKIAELKKKYTEDKT